MIKCFVHIKDFAKRFLAQCLLIIIIQSKFKFNQLNIPLIAKIKTSIKYICSFKII